MLLSVKGSVCLLPLLSGEQTMEVIAIIERKFQDSLEGWRSQSHFRIPA